MRLFEDALVGAVPEPEPGLELYVEPGLRLSEQRRRTTPRATGSRSSTEWAPTREQAVERCRERAREVLDGLELSNRATGTAVDPPR